MEPFSPRTFRRVRSCRQPSPSVHQRVTTSQRRCRRRPGCRIRGPRWPDARACRRGRSQAPQRAQRRPTGSNGYRGTLQDFTRFKRRQLGFVANDAHAAADAARGRANTGQGTMRRRRRFTRLLERNVPREGAEQALHRGGQPTRRGRRDWRGPMERGTRVGANPTVFSVTPGRASRGRLADEVALEGRPDFFNF